MCMHTLRKAKWKSENSRIVDKPFLEDVKYSNKQKTMQIDIWKWRLYAFATDFRWMFPCACVCVSGVFQATCPQLILIW